MGCRCLLVTFLVALLAGNLEGCSSLLGIDEAGPPPDAPVDAPELCASVGIQCVGEDVLRTCAAAGQPPANESCAWGCSEGGGAHCLKLVPMGGALLSQDLTPNTALSSTTLSGVVMVDTD